ncbi:MAG TPA: hypothetical protein VGE29_09460 [Prosthecobacter sp.]
MIRQFPQEETSGSLVSKMAQAAVVLTAGAVVGTRARKGGALLLAGLASWALARKLDRKSGTAVLPNSGAEPANRLPPLPAPGSLEDVCLPSQPFLERDEDSELKPRSLDELRAALQPPAELFVPPADPSTQWNPPAWLNEAPVFVEVADSTAIPPHPRDILPDTISIPLTPDPPAHLLAGGNSSPAASVPPAPWSGLQSSQLSPPPPPQTPTAFPPLAEEPPFSLPLNEPPGGEESGTSAGHEKDGAPQGTPPISLKKNFLDWLRE